MIKARATVKWMPQLGPGHYLLTFNRTSLPRAPVPTPVTLLAEPVSHSSGEFETPQLASYFSNVKNSTSTTSESYTDQSAPKPSASDVAASITPFIMATFNADGQVINLSKSWYRFSGLDEEGSLGSGWLASMHPDDVVGATTAWAKVLRNGCSHWSYQARYRKDADGTYCWFLIRAQPYKDAAGKVLRWYASMMDINEWVMARIEADKRRQVMLTLFSQTDIMLWGIDSSSRLYIREGRLVWDPSIIEKLLETDAIDEPTQTEDSPNNTSRTKLVNTIRAVLSGNISSPIVEHWEGDHYFRTRCVAERTTQGDSVQAVLALNFDITDERARNTLRMENQRLANNEKVALDSNNLKSRFLANISHEIRTPISGIIGLGEHLLECDLSQQQIEFAENILESAKFLLTIINDVLDLSKIESGHMDVEAIPFSPNKLVSDVIVPLRLQAQEKGLSLFSHSEIPPDAVLMGDAWRMRQILTNLVGNSLKFTEVGHVGLVVRAVDKAEPGTMVLQYIVHDSGVGIEQDAMKALFKPFHQADSSTARLHGGTGLGLVICRQLLELMGGGITLESTPGKGTTATCNVPFPIYEGPMRGILDATSLPRRAHLSDGDKRHRHFRKRRRSSTNSSQQQSEGLSRSNASDGKLHVLVVEDNPVNRKVIALNIEKLGYSVSTVCDGQEALHYLCRQSRQPRPVVCFIDCQMPVIDGYEATRRIREDHEMFDEEIRALPIIALTASAIKGDKEKCWEAGMDDYLTKPTARHALKRVLSKWTATDLPRKRGRNKSFHAD